ncbi:fungal-specific transcription factor domain-containing protein [Mycena capillaripes]|nr:fungal-specific transcription factor domain-containing protein [Mycena capillaripes]
MSSEEPDTVETFTAPAKKRRIQRACDACRQKRRACDGLRSSTKKCTHCVEIGMECIYSGAPTSTKRQSYTEVLEARLALTEKLLRKLSAERGRSKSPKRTESSEWSKDSPIVLHGKGATVAGGPESGSAPDPTVELVAMSIRSINQRESQHPDEDAIAEEELSQEMNALRLGGHQDRFLGKSSGAMLVKAAADLKAEYTEATPDTRPPRQWTSRRVQYWSNQPWKNEVDTLKPRYAFPPPDVLSALVDLYFEHTNMYFPLLHRPTFDRAMADNLHLRDEKFGANVLLVCAIGSRFSDDPRVFDATAPLNCGWKLFSQLRPEIEHLFLTPTLYDLQRCCLTIQFMEGSVSQANWTLVGIGIRMAQEVGAHRRQNTQRHTVETELWRRAFWVLVAYDRLVSCTLGRPCAMQYDDFDIDLPTEVDDEYWEHEDPTRAFCQPPGRPSRVAFFNAFLRLNNILAFTLHLLYSLSKAKDVWSVRDSTWDEYIVVEFDSALNKWVESIPEHLRWDAHRADAVFFKQSVALYCSYYHVQMTTHRPYIPTIRNAPPTSLPSLAICTNAARSCSHVADVWRQRMGETPMVILLPALSTAGIVLLLNVWSGKRTGVAPQMNTAITEVHKCMQALRVCETRWQMAGLFWDILNELATVGQVPLPARTPAIPETPASQHGTSTPPANRHKRAHSGGAEGHYTRALEPPEGVWAADPLAPPTNFDGAQFAWLGAQQQGSALPMYSADLERLPVYPQASASYTTAPHTAAQYRSAGGWAALPNFMPSTSAAPQQYDATGVDAALGGTSTEDILSMDDNDAIAMWANAPTSFEAEDWGTYFSVMNEMNQGPPPPP